MIGQIVDGALPFDIYWVVDMHVCIWGGTWVRSHDEILV